MIKENVKDFSDLKSKDKSPKNDFYEKHKILDESDEIIDEYKF